MIAQDFLVHMREASPSRSPAEGYMRVLASVKHSHAYGVGSMCAHTGKSPARARPARSVTLQKAEKCNKSERNQKTFVNSTSGLVQYAG